MAIDRKDAVPFTAAAVVKGKRREDLLAELTDAGLSVEEARHLAETMGALHLALAETTGSKNLTQELLLQKWTESAGAASSAGGAGGLNGPSPAVGLVVYDTTNVSGVPYPADGASTARWNRRIKLALLLVLGIGFVWCIWLLPILADVLFDYRTGGNNPACTAQSNPDVPEEDVTPASDRVLHVLLIGLTDEAGAGQLMQQDLDSLQEMFAQEVPIGRWRLTFVRGTDCTPRNVLRAVRRMGQRSRPGDTLFCYYSGHGAIDPGHAAGDPSGGHFFQLHSDSGHFPFRSGPSNLLRNTLFNTLLAQPGRLKVLVSDSCSGIGQAGTSVAVTKEYLQKGPTPLEQLLLFHRGYVDLNASSRRQYAYATEGMGSWFTVAFRQTVTTTWFELTDDSLAALRSAGVPQEVLAKLSDLKDKACNTTEAFQLPLLPHLTPSEYTQYQDLICRHAARQADDWTPFVRQVARNTNAIYLEQKKAILDSPSRLPGSFVRAIKQQKAMTPKCRMRVVKDRTIPSGPERIIRRTHREFVLTGP